MKLRTKVMLLVFCTVTAILLLNQYPVSKSLQQSLVDLSGDSMRDVTERAALSPDLIDALARRDVRSLAAPAQRLEGSANCSGVAIVDRDFQVWYNSSDFPIEEHILREYRQSPSPQEGVRVVREGKDRTVLYTCCPVYRDGELQGSVVAKLICTGSHPGIQKAQRDLNAITTLVLLIALISVWELTDNITSTMFDLEPVEIAQLLVERNALIDSVRDGILSVDREGRLLHANRSALEAFQRAIPRSNPKTCSFQDLFPHVPFASVFNGEHPSYDVECLMGTDSFYASFIPIRIHKPQHESLLVTFRPKQEVVRFAEDITSVRSYIEALRSQMHEFNNKLQVMSGLVQGKKYSELEDYLYGLVRLRNREIEQTNSKIKDPILAAFLMSKFDRAAEQQVDLVLTDASKLELQLPEVLVQDLVVIVGNLLENAFDAVQNCPMRTVTLELTEASGNICITVWDSGAVIPKELQECMFDYGVTSKPSGNGIGLFLVHQACRRHDGYVLVSSSEEEGTEFCVHLPYRKGAHPDDGSCIDR